MARVLIAEPNRDVRALLEIFVARFGHEPILYEGGGIALETADAAIVEPGDTNTRRLATSLRASGVPLVFVSIFPPDSESIAMQPIAYLLKPFSRHALEQALTAAVSIGRNTDRAR